MTVPCVVKGISLGASLSLGSHQALRAAPVQDQLWESMFENLP